MLLGPRWSLGPGGVRNQGQRAWQPAGGWREGRDSGPTPTLPGLSSLPAQPPEGSCCPQPVRTQCRPRPGQGSSCARGHRGSTLPRAPVESLTRLWLEMGLRQQEGQSRTVAACWGSGPCSSPGLWRIFNSGSRTMGPRPTSPLLTRHRARCAVPVEWVGDGKSDREADGLLSGPERQCVS